MWNPIINKLKGRPTTWKGRYLSMGRRAALQNSTLNKIILYYLSFSKAPVQVWKYITKIHNNFLWGGSEIKKKNTLGNMEKCM